LHTPCTIFILNNKCSVLLAINPEIIAVLPVVAVWQKNSDGDNNFCIISICGLYKFMKSDTLRSTHENLRKKSTAA